jgi:hypothetical protein
VGPPTTDRDSPNGETGAPSQGSDVCGSPARERIAECRRMACRHEAMPDTCRTAMISMSAGVTINVLRSLSAAAKASQIASARARQVTHIDQPIASDLDVASEPRPHGVAGSREVDDWTRGGGEPQFVEPARYGQTDVRFAAADAPALHHRRNEFVHFAAFRADAPGGIVEVLVDHQRAGGLERSSHARQQITGPFEERQYPSQPGAVRSYPGESGDVEVDLLRVNVPEATLGGSCLERLEELAGLVEGQHAASRTDDIGQVERGVAGAASDVEQRLPGGEPGTTPQAEHLGAPDAVLHSEPVDFLVLRADHVLRFLTQDIRPPCNFERRRTKPVVVAD